MEWGTPPGVLVGESQPQTVGVVPHPPDTGVGEKAKVVGETRTRIKVGTTGLSVPAPTVVVGETTPAALQPVLRSPQSPLPVRPRPPPPSPPPTDDTSFPRIPHSETLSSRPPVALRRESVPLPAETEVTVPVRPPTAVLDPLLVRPPLPPPLLLERDDVPVWAVLPRRSVSQPVLLQRTPLSPWLASTLGPLVRFGLSSPLTRRPPARLPRNTTRNPVTLNGPYSTGGPRVPVGEGEALLTWGGAESGSGLPPSTPMDPVTGFRRRPVSAGGASTTPRVTVPDDVDGGSVPTDRADGCRRPRGVGPRPSGGHSTHDGPRPSYHPSTPSPGTLWGPHPSRHGEHPVGVVRDRGPRLLSTVGSPPVRGEPGPRGPGGEVPDQGLVGGPGETRVPGG